MTALVPALLRLWQGPRVRDRLVMVRQFLSPTAIATSYGITPASKRRYGSYLARLEELL